MPDPAPDQPFLWCLVANVTRDPHPEGLSGELRLGLKHFAPGAKLYCFPQQWGDGGERLRVLGRHRGGSKLFEMVIGTKWLTNWRAQKVYRPDVIQALRYHHDDSEASEKEAKEWAEIRNRMAKPPIEGS